MEDKERYHYREVDSCLSCEYVGTTLRCIYLWEGPPIDVNHICDAFDKIKETPEETTMAKNMFFMSETVCQGCGKRPDEIGEYIEAAKHARMTPMQFVREEEGTFNKENEHFLCTQCYIEAGMPTSTGRLGWKCP